MISLSLYRQHLLRIVRLQIDTGAYIDISYKSKLYRIHIEDLHTPVKQVRAKRSAGLTQAIKPKVCSDCKKLMLNNICMSSLCPSNLRRSIVKT